MCFSMHRFCARREMKRAVTCCDRCALTYCCSEVPIIQQLYNGVYREQDWVNSDAFGPLFKVAIDPNAKITAFFPSDDSWQRVADNYCMSQQGVLNTISNLRQVLANYIKAHMVPGIVLPSSGFRDGMVFQTLAVPGADPNAPTLNHTLNKVVV